MIAPPTTALHLSQARRRSCQQDHNLQADQRQSDALQDVHLEPSLPGGRVQRRNSLSELRRQMHRIAQGHEKSESADSPKQLPGDPRILSPLADGGHGEGGARKDEEQGRREPSQKEPDVKHRAFAIRRRQQHVQGVALDHEEDR